MARATYSQGRILIGRLPGGADIVEAITRIANEEEIRLATVEVHGTVARAALTVLDQETRFPVAYERETGMEIGSMSGTISQFKGRSLARLGAVLGAPDGGTIAGTVALGTIAHACEVVIVELIGGTLTRDFDMATGLPLWRNNALLIAATDAPTEAGSADA
jgi:predicted DNA-binding protein with PD1-like motif